jgi:tight adherence protein C
MTVVIFLGAIAGFGCLGLHRGLRSSTPSLETLARTMARPMRPTVVGPDTGGWRSSAGSQVMALVGLEVVPSDPRWSSLRTNLAITGVSWDELTSKMVIAGGGGLVLPPLLWIFAQWAGASLSLVVPIVIAVLAVPAGLSLPIAELFENARKRRRHVRVVVGTFVDLVVLGLAGGVGIDGAMFAASQVSSDWAAKRMARALSKARDSGQSPWLALGQLGEEIGVNELIELSTTLQLAGTEGARIRQSLMARSTALRRHEQADAESEANAMTERLFLPGALLLVGFLLFVGYPAFSRILGGF